MDKDKLFEHYEKLYFHELEIREKITARIQFTFALLASAFTIMSYMIRMLNYDAAPVVIYIFWGLSALFLLFFILCLMNLVPAYWGNLYQLIPTPVGTDEYKGNIDAHNKKLEQYNSDYPKNVQQITATKTKVKDYLYNSYRDCSTHNSIANEWRSEQTYIGFKRLLISVVPLIFTGLLFVINDLDLSSPKVKQENEKALLSKEIKQLKNRLDKVEKVATPIRQEVKKMPENNDNGQTVDIIPPPPPEPSTPEPRDSMEDLRDDIATYETKE